MIATNPGEPMRQLEHIASGGELSRVMLALKVSVGEPGRREPCGVGRPRPRKLDQRGFSPCSARMVFDEIDTGIGGRAAEAVGKKLKSLARANQVLCVTHLPQIATFADHHYVIEKKARNGRTRNAHPPHCRRRTHRGSSPHVKRSQTDRYLAQTCRADD